MPRWRFLSDGRLGEIECAGDGQRAVPAMSELTFDIVANTLRKDLDFLSDDASAASPFPSETSAPGVSLVFDCAPRDALAVFREGDEDRTPVDRLEIVLEPASANAAKPVITFVDEPYLSLSSLFKGYGALSATQANSFLSLRPALVGAEGRDAGRPPHALIVIDDQRFADLEGFIRSAGATCGTLSIVTPTYRQGRPEDRDKLDYFVFSKDAFGVVATRLSRLSLDARAPSRVAASSSSRGAAETGGPAPVRTGSVRDRLASLLR